MDLLQLLQQRYYGTQKGTGCPDNLDLMEGTVAAAEAQALVGDSLSREEEGEKAILDMLLSDEGNGELPVPSSLCKARARR